MGKAVFCALSLIVCAFERNSSFARSVVAELFALGEYRSTRPSAKSPAPCCGQNWLIPSTRANSSSRTALLVRRIESARQNDLHLRVCHSHSMNLAGGQRRTVELKRVMANSPSFGCSEPKWPFRRDIHEVKPEKVAVKDMADVPCPSWDCAELRL